MWETKRRTVHFKLTFTEVLHFDVRAVVAPDVSPLGASSHAQADAFVPGAGGLVLEAVHARVARVGSACGRHVDESRYLVSSQHHAFICSTKNSHCSIYISGNRQAVMQRVKNNNM